jgi:hypothetical protein
MCFLLMLLVQLLLLSVVHVAVDDASDADGMLMPSLLLLLPLIFTFFATAYYEIDTDVMLFLLLLMMTYIESVEDGTKVLGRAAMGISEFAHDAFETALSKYEAYGKCLTVLAAHRHFHTALRIHRHCNRRPGHFPRTVPHGIGRGEGYGDTVVTFLERVDTATLFVAAEILGLPVASRTRNTRSEMSIPISFGGTWEGTWLPWRMQPTSERLVWQWAPVAIRFLTPQDARVRGSTHDDVPMKPTMHGQLAALMTTTVSRRPSAPDGDDGDSEPMWSLEASLSWASLDTACGYHTLAESEPRMTTVLAMFPPKCRTVARATCVAETRSDNEHLTRSCDGLPSLVPLPVFATDTFSKATSRH